MPKESSNDYIERIEKDCEQSLDELFSDYSDFLLWSIEEWNYVFPETAPEMFELFKQSTGSYHFHFSKRDFLLEAGIERDIDSINAALLILEPIVNHPRLNTYEEQMHLFNEAKAMFHGAKYAGGCMSSTLHIYYLLKYGYFNKYLMPSKYLAVESSTDFFGKVYGKYILLYEYLQNEKKAISDGNTSLQAVTSNTPGLENKLKQTLTTTEMKKQRFEDIWEVDAQKAFYEKLMNELCKLEIQGRNVVKIVDGKYCWAKELGKGSKTYLAAFFYECDKAKFLDGSKYGGSKPVIRAVLENTFNISSVSDPFISISKDKSGKFDEYRIPFRNIINSILKS
jgi:hypothetical protein